MVEMKVFCRVIWVRGETDSRRFLSMGRLTLFGGALSIQIKQLRGGTYNYRVNR